MSQQETNTRIPQKGDFLISEPFLPDPNFERTVVLICEHNEDGTFGLVLNKPSILKFSDVIQEEETRNFNEVLYVGGPVQQDSLHFLHRSPVVEGSLEIRDGLFWGGNYEQLLVMINSGQADPHDFKFFLGYSGWAPGQLLDEMKDNSWIVYNEATPEYVFDTQPDILWREILKNMGGKYRMFSNYPIDPRLN